MLTLLHCGFLGENFTFTVLLFKAVIKKDIILVSRTLDPPFFISKEGI